MKNHSEVMDRAKSLIGLPYVWARDFGFTLESTVNPTNVAYWNKTDPKNFPKSKVALLLRPVYANKEGGDCSGLITYSCGIPKIGSSQLWEMCENKHYFDLTRPLADQIPKGDEAVIVWRSGHIGFSCGDGMVIESGSTQYGVGHVSIDKPQTGNPWTGYGYLRKYIDYSDPVVSPVIPMALPITEEDVIVYQTHVQSIGWLEAVKDGDISGTVGNSLRIEAIRIRLNKGSGNIKYRTHVQDIGWMDFVNNNTISGTVGKSKRVEAIEIQLTGDILTTHDIMYQTHVEDIGWMPWVKNGQISGTIGQGKRIEAIRIKAVQK